MQNSHKSIVGAVLLSEALVREILTVDYDRAAFYRNATAFGRALQHCLRHARDAKVNGELSNRDRALLAELEGMWPDFAAEPPGRGSQGEF